MYNFKQLTSTDGFDFNNLDNARQNNYAWSMAELGDYIYVGTGRNVPLTILQSIAPGIEIPAILKPVNQDNLAEIWRYKKMKLYHGKEYIKHHLVQVLQASDL